MMRSMGWATILLLCALENGCAYQIVQSGKLSADKLASIEEKTSQARGLPFLHTLDYELVDEAQTRAVLTALALRDMPREKWDAWQSIFRHLDTIPEGFHLYDEILNLMVDQAAGFYDPFTKKLYISSKPLPVGPVIPLMEAMLQRDFTREFILSHEMVHALQDQHFNLEKKLMSKSAEFDESLAVHAVVEGDALVGGMIALTGNATLVFTQRDLGRKMQAEASGAASLQKVPPVIREYLVFPYYAGFEFVQAFAAKSSWQNIDSVYKNLPVSSEQVIHPEKYFSGEKPVPVSLAKHRAKLGEGWTVLEENTLGEAFIGVIFGKEAAAGWGGDRFFLARKVADAKQEVFVWETRWDTEKDAQEFFTAVKAWQDRRGIRGTDTINPNSEHLDCSGDAVQFTQFEGQTP